MKLEIIKETNIKGEVMYWLQANGRNVEDSTTSGERPDSIEIITIMYERFKLMHAQDRTKKDFNLCKRLARWVGSLSGGWKTLLLSRSKRSSMDKLLEVIKSEEI